MHTVYLALAAAAGAGLALQAAINSQLRSATGSALWASILSAGTTVILLSLAELFARETLHVRRLGGYPWWIWTGGIMGAVYVFAIVALTRYLGVVLLFAAIVVGQLVTGLLVDHYGWFNAPVQRITPSRLFGVLLLVAGMALIRR